MRVPLLSLFICVCFLIVSAEPHPDTQRLAGENLPPLVHALNSIITTKGLERLVELVSPAIPQTLYETGLPDIKGEASGLEYALTELTFTNVDLPGIFATFDPSGISGGCEGGSVTLGFNYSFIYTNYPPFTIKGTGGVVSIIDMDISVVCDLSVTEDNRETLTVVGESLNIGDMVIEIGDSSFINIILSIMTPIIKNVLEDVIGQVVGGIIEELVNPGVNIDVVLPMGDSEKSNTRYTDVFVDKRLVADPVFTSDMMNVLTAARFFTASYTDPSNVSSATIQWDGVDVSYSDAPLPETLTGHEIEIVVKTDVWKSQFDCYVRRDFFDGESINGTAVFRMPCEDDVDEDCYIEEQVDTNLLDKFLPGISGLYPSTYHDVRFVYNWHDDVPFVHDTMYAGILLGFDGDACLEVKQKTTANWTSILCVDGHLELSELANLVPGTPNIVLTFYFHKAEYEYSCPMCNSANWTASNVELAVRAFVNGGVIPFLERWSRERPLPTNIFEGLYLISPISVYDKDLGCVTIGGNFGAS